jgi:hypothetical protein
MSAPAGSKAPPFSYPEQQSTLEPMKAEADHPARRKVLPLNEKFAGHARRHFEKLSMRSTRLAMQLRPKYACGSLYLFN